MLNGVLMVMVPMVALLGAAFYIYTKTQAEGPHGNGQRSRRTQSWSSAFTNRQSSTQRRRRRERSDSDTSGSYDSPESGFVEEEHCEICFEDKGKVQLYPCKHSDICETCVNKLLISNRRQCPFCRARIDGFVDMTSGHLFG